MANLLVPYFLLLLTAFVIPFYALPSTPSFSPLVATLAAMIFQITAVKDYTSGDNRILRHRLLLGAFTAVAITAARARPSISATSDPETSLMLLLISSVTTYLFALATIAIYVYRPRFLRDPYLSLLLFPAAWATCMGIMSMFLFGRIVTWSPLISGGWYRWLVPYFGAPGQDWIVAAWALVVVRVLEAVGVSSSHFSLPPNHSRDESSDQHRDENINYDLPARESDESPPRQRVLFEAQKLVAHPPNQESSLVQRDRSRYYLAAFLFLLALPSFSSSPGSFSPSLSRPPLASETTTDLSLACVLPRPRNLRSPKAPDTSLEQYLTESTTVGSLARIHLWPENAVRFENRRDRNRTIAKVQNLTSMYGIFVGFGFNEPIFDAGLDRKEKRRTGMMLLSPQGIIIMEYYKNHLVPSKLNRRHPQLI